MERCEQCGRAIGDDETACLDGDRIVCGLCKTGMGKQASRKGNRVRPAVVIAAGCVAIVVAIAAIGLRLRDLHATIDRQAGAIADLRSDGQRQAIELDRLRRLVNDNATMANKLAERHESDVADVRRTINANAEAANHNSESTNRMIHALSADLDSLTRTVNYNADVANSNRFR